MKFILFIIAFTIIQFINPLIAWTEEDRNQEQAQINLWSKELQDSKDLPPAEKLEALRQGLINLQHRRKYVWHDPRIDSLADQIQSSILAIPGHADHFSANYNRMYEEAKQLYIEKGELADWWKISREQLFRFSTLKHLPGPETAWVLGNMLADTWLPPSGIGEEYRIPSRAHLAISTLKKLGMRDLPDNLSISTPSTPAVWQAWWEEVKSGQRAFSFTGQAVEYRFKPDETWDTFPISNPPDDGPKKPAALPATTQPAPISPAAAISAPKPTTTETNRSLWPAIGAGLAGLALALAAFLWRKSNGK